VPVEDLDRLRVTLHAPVVHREVGDDADRVHGYPAPEDAFLGHGVGFHFALHLNVEDLKGLGGLEGDYFGGGVHDCGVGGDGPFDGRLWVVQVDDCNLGVVGLAGLSDADEFVRLHGESFEGNRVGADAHVLELKVLGELDGKL